MKMLRALHDDPLIIKATRIDVLYGTADLMDQAYAAAPRLLMPAFILYGNTIRSSPPNPSAPC